MRTLRLLVAYDGTDFHGWQRQVRGPTIQGALEEAFATVARCDRQEVRIVGSGRTDAGVHAVGQVASLRTAHEGPPGRLLPGLNGVLPAGIVVRRIEDAPDGFHARRSATGKLYRYTIHRAPHPPLFDARFVLWLRGPLDLEAMETASRLLVGRRDFAAFTTHAARQQHGTVRHLRRLDLRVQGEYLHLLFEGDGFLYNMVRAMTGTLLEVGRGRRPPGEIVSILQDRDRARAGENAPARGLCLVRVSYPGEVLQ